MTAKPPRIEFQGAARFPTDYREGPARSKGLAGHDRTQVPVKQQKKTIAHLAVQGTIAAVNQANPNSSAAPQMLRTRSLIPQEEDSNE